MGLDIWQVSPRQDCTACPLAAIRKRESSPRWKEIVEPAPGRFMHHLELDSVDDIDDEVPDWLQGAWITANL
jgi:hypothetical protein